MKKTQLSIVVGLSVSLFALLVVTSVYPYIDDFLIENPFWNGLSVFYSEMEPVRIGDLDKLEGYGRGCTLFIIGPGKGFEVSEVNAVSEFLDGGGRVVLADDFGSGNQLLEFLGLDVRFDGRLVVDPVFREKNAVLPRVDGEYYGVDYLVLNYPTFLTGSSDGVVVWSSPLSRVKDSVDSGFGEMDEYAIVAEVGVGEGVLVLVSDSSVFINSMIDKGGNRELRNDLALGKLFIDEAHTDYTVMGYLKQGLTKTYTLLGFFEIRYSLILVAVIGVLRLRLTVTPEYIDPVEELMQRHPEYDREQLEWLEMERSKARGDI